MWADFDHVTEIEKQKMQTKDFQTICFSIDYAFSKELMSLWKSDIPVSRVKHFSKLFELFIRKRSVHDELSKFLKHVLH